MIKKLKHYKHKKGFTLIELIVVMAIIGILVLLAAPRFLGRTEDALVTRVKNDIRVAEDKVTELIASDDRRLDAWEDTEVSDLDAIASNNELFGHGGQVLTIPDDTYKLVPGVFVDNEIRSDLEGDFYINDEGDVFYHGTGVTMPSVDNEDNLVMPDYYVEVTNNDFDYILSTNAPNGDGYYHYTGSDEYVVLPETINDKPVTDTYAMFYETNVKGVAGDIATLSNVNRMFVNSQSESLDLRFFDTSNVTNMERMFYGATGASIDLSTLDTSKVNTMEFMFTSTKALSLDLSNFDTSNLINMEHMFWRSKAETLDLRSFDTSNVTTMFAMFNETAATSIDVSSFNTSNVTKMAHMFQYTNASVLDLRNFDTSNVESMWSMFGHAQASTVDLSSFDTYDVDLRYMFNESNISTVYAKSDADASRLSSSSYKPSTVTVTVKP